MAYRKRHEECTLFLENGFGTDHRQKLMDAGFRVVCFADDFPDEAKNRQSVSDPRIIRHCHEKKYVLVTLDKQMRHTHVEDIKKTDIAIIATESCDKYSAEQWIDALLSNKTKIRSKVKRFQRPWFAHLAIHGELRKIETISQQMTTRRKQEPEEQGQGEDLKVNGNQES